MYCKHNHAIRGPQDRDRWGGCIRCRRDRQRVYARECRAARRKLAAIEAALGAAI